MLVNLFKNDLLSFVFFRIVIVVLSRVGDMNKLHTGMFVLAKPVIKAFHHVSAKIKNRNSVWH